MQETPVFVSRAGGKLQCAFDSFKVTPNDLVCADFGCSTGGFTDCLLQSGAAKVYSVDTAYGELAWKLRNDPRVVVLERTNALHVQLPEKVELITIDTGWTKQKLILPSALNNLLPNGKIITLIKPHYEAPKAYIRKGLLMEDKLEEVMNSVKNDIEALGLIIEGIVQSPILGKRGQNTEYLAFLHKKNATQ